MNNESKRLLGIAVREYLELRKKASRLSKQASDAELAEDEAKDKVWCLMRNGEVRMATFGRTVLVWNTEGRLQAVSAVDLLENL